MVTIYTGSVQFNYTRDLQTLACAISEAYCGGMPFIPKVRRWAREFDEALFCEYDILGLQISICRDHSGPFVLQVISSELWQLPWTLEEAGHSRQALCDQWVNVLLRSIDGVDLQPTTMKNSEEIAVIDSHSALNSRHTFGEVQALFTQQMCCGLRFIVDPNNPEMAVLSRDLLGHRISLYALPWGGGDYLAITPSPTALGLLSPPELKRIDRIDLSGYIELLFRNHPAIRGGSVLSLEDVQSITQTR